MRDDAGQDERLREVGCAICGKEVVEGTEPYLLAENQWLDRVRIMQFHEELAVTEGVVAVCCIEHVRELVAHWMATGSLTHPFAEVPGIPTVRTDPAKRQADGGIARVLGELMVDRDSMLRLLQENPYALTAMLEALISGLAKKHPQSVYAIESVEELAMC